MFVDGYMEDERGRFSLAVPDEEVNSHINRLSSVRTLTTA
jgi:hypothetical protein